ncbi:NaeI family type II restriction endonuclease [Tsukamurella pseudospumae]|uniref:NaeI family type II restriction endonuclease n=1 Tax=Tsukamurella pseudospumae TaxID=239498 RepID=UPI0009EEAB7D|nr:NaeI family type II restriction endonuclease [Tsukamurella pseudospumae]
MSSLEPEPSTLFKYVDLSLPLDVDSPILGHTRKRMNPPPPNFTKSKRPKIAFGPRPSLGAGTPPTRAEDPELWEVHDAVLRADSTGTHFALCIRFAFDQILDGQRTGRWDVTQLSKTEKTHIGTLVEIWLQREFQFEDGHHLDFAISGIDVDCKWSQNIYEWEIPLEMYSDRNEIALVVWANEDTARWAAGLVRIAESVLKPMGKQRDKKRRLNDTGIDSILWIFREQPMIRNVLNEHQSVAARLAAQNSGQAAVNLLFREVQGRLINQSTIATAAQQIDASKRARDARRHLASEGILVLGPYQAHAAIAAELGLPRPGRSQFVSARVTPFSDGDSGDSAEIDGTSWRLAIESDPVIAAPRLPKVSW